MVRENKVITLKPEKIGTLRRYNRYGDLMNVKEVCELIGCSRQFVYGLIKSGRIHGRKLGKGYKVSKQSLIFMIEEKTE